MRIFLKLSFVLLTCGAAFGQSPAIAPGEAAKALQSKVPDVSYCELIRHPKLYDKKYVRVRGTYRVAGGEYSNLFDLSCYGELSPSAKIDAQTGTWLWFDPMFESLSEAGAVKALQQLKAEEHGADIVLVGKFYGPRRRGGYGHLGLAKYQVVAVRVDEVKPVALK